MKKEVARLLHVHKTGSETLFDHVPRELLPVEYGGSNGSIKDLKMEWKKRIESHRDYLMDASNWLIKDINDNNTVEKPKVQQKILSKQNQQIEERMERMSFD